MFLENVLIITGYWGYLVRSCIVEAYIAVFVDNLKHFLKDILIDEKYISIDEKLLQIVQSDTLIRLKDEKIIILCKDISSSS